MQNTTLCYIIRQGADGEEYLMLYRNKKKNDLNEGKWVGVGGKFEEGESPEECLIREVREETGLTLTEYTMRGIVTFVSDVWGTEYMFLYTASASGEIGECTEGELRWIPREKILSLPLWEGDKVFLGLIAGEHPFFSLKLSYHGDKLVDVSLNGDNSSAIGIIL